MKSEFSSNVTNFTEIRITRKVPEGIYTTKHHEALGNIWRYLSYNYNLISIREKPSYLEDGYFYYKFVVILKGTPKHSSNVCATIESVFEFQDWGEKAESEL
ncbi:MAG: hypothetical protein ACFFG0_02095 [Candidatus Thorarchaeota archaeon]